MANAGVPVLSPWAKSFGNYASGYYNAAKSLWDGPQKAPDVAAPPPTPTPANSGNLMQNAEEDQQQKVKGEAANFLTAGGGAGLGPSSNISTSRAVLLGS